MGLSLIVSSKPIAVGQDHLDIHVVDITIELPRNRLGGLSPRENTAPFDAPSRRTR